MNEQYAWLYEKTEDRIRAADELLSRPAAIQKEIDRKKAKAEMLRSAVSSFEIRLQKDKVLSTPDPARTQGMLSAAIDEEREILRLEEERELAYLASVGYIMDIRDPTVQEAMILHYLDGLNWDRITDRLCYSRSHLYRLRRRGLEEVEGMLRNVVKNTAIN